ncbi:uncharacterized protein ACLA_087040 [Aspergillus clavatus NRRL 1]|uniref:Phospholipase, patatin family protein n=1 Tax=Aspergillus clavatus (strain ATCC 1007 / CBS 513.65 / DSM 816 / NCTC 3887 / NRRL 1 / QM 1276 / 107) TaxID=344612 RepID=A1CUL4_ASPCL|nr:phospholipase, patatin family protein [Aspergillus clavatus NRRL 1]EAW07001.1 phospholipase, patatin family protein [Aspergillus clavatus NRRL 1]
MHLEPKKLNLLSLDGGGIRGLSSLYVLKQMMEAIDPDQPPKPCEVFDMIGGTSTGGLIAIMLGRLKMDVDQCIDAYYRLSKQAFTRKSFFPVTIRGGFNARFDSKKLEQALKTVIAEQGLDEDALLQDPDASCHVFVCATRTTTGSTTSFTSFYHLRGETHLYRVMKIWEAGRATSAAPSFFDPLMIIDSVMRNERRFIDGALGANNAVRKVWEHAMDVWKSDRFEKSESGRFEDQLGCLVSIGTGTPPEMQYTRGIFQTLKLKKGLVTDTEVEAEDFAEEHANLVDEHRYFRFNVPGGLAQIGLEEIKKINQIELETNKYLAAEAVSQEIDICARSLRR